MHLALTMKRKGLSLGPILVLAIIFLGFGIIATMTITKNIRYFVYEKSSEAELITLSNTYRALKSSIERTFDFELGETIDYAMEKRAIPWNDSWDFSSFLSYFGNDNGKIFENGIKEYLEEIPVLNLVNIPEKVKVKNLSLEYEGNKLNVSFSYSLKIEKKVSMRANLTNYIEFEGKVSKKITYLNLEKAFYCMKELAKKSDNSFSFKKLPEGELKAELYNFLSSLSSNLNNCTGFERDFEIADLVKDSKGECDCKLQYPLISVKLWNGQGKISFEFRLRVKCSASNPNPECLAGYECSSSCDAFGFCTECNKYLENLPCSPAVSKFPVNTYGKEGYLYVCQEDVNGKYRCLKNFGEIKETFLYVNCGVRDYKIDVRDAKKVVFNGLEYDVSGIDEFDLCAKEVPKIDGLLYLISESNGTEYIIRKIQVKNELSSCISNLKAKISDYTLTYKNDFMDCDELEEAIRAEIKNFFYSSGCYGYDIEIKYLDKPRCTGKISVTNEFGRKANIEIDFRNKRTDETEAKIFATLNLKPYVTG